MEYNPILLAESIVNVFSGFVAMLVAFYSYKSYRISKDVSMIGLMIGFLFLMLGLVVRALLFIVAMDVFSKPGALLTSVMLGKLISDMSTLFAYLSMAIGYTFSLHKKIIPAILTIPRVFLGKIISWIIEFISSLFLLYIVIIIIARYLENRDTLTFQVLTAFLSLLLAHVLMIISVFFLNIVIYIIGVFLRFLAFLLFLLTVSSVVKKE